MASAPVSPRPSDRSEIDRPGERSAGERSEVGPRPPDKRTARDERETYGALAVERQAKDDGRSLILYTRLTGADAEASTGRERAGT
jgi:hypothetical protein